MKNPFNLLYCGDRKMVHAIYLSLLSALEVTDRVFNVYILTMNAFYKGKSLEGINEDDRLLIENMAKTYNEKNKVFLYDITPEYNKTILSSPNHNNYYTPFCMIRLFATSYIKNGKVLYLDTDTLIASSLEQFETIDISSVHLASSLDYLGHIWIRKNYFNSGVLYMNMDKIVEDRLFERCISYLMKEKHFYPDQDALNDLSEHILIPYKYNEQRNPKNDTVVNHFPKRIFFFFDPIKPWEVERVRKRLRIRRYDNVYRRYISSFPFEKYNLVKPNID